MAENGKFTSSSLLRCYGPSVDVHVNVQFELLKESSYYSTDHGSFAHLRNQNLCLAAAWPVQLLWKACCFSCDRVYAHIEIVVAFSIGNFFGFLVITRHHQVGFRRSLQYVYLTSLPDFSKTLWDLQNLWKTKNLETKMVGPPPPKKRL